FDDEDRSGTLYRDIQRLLPGEVLEAAADGRVALRRYWAFGPLEPLRLPSHDACVEAFRAVFDDAVRVRLRSPTTPALMLSGGIDSAAI
ncbi:asparagine synthase-related protein, partial [Escherichia coli]|uniref:asparagine synthase-related protein n=1 Tax=Escherichia coli TaxID=562 RepID=UPI0030790DB1